MTNSKTYAFVTGMLFLVVTIVHGLRLVFGWDAVFAGYQIPMWVSWIGIFVPGFLSYSGLRLWRTRF